MRRKYILMSVISMCLMVPAAYCGDGHAVEVSMGDFSADMVSSSGGETVEAKFYMSGNKMRTEASGSIVIARLDKNIAYMVMPSERMYMEQPIRKQMLPKTSKELGAEVERVELEKENIDGKEAQKYKVTYDEGSSRQEVYQWLTDSGFPIKMADVDGKWSVEYRNLAVGPQPASLFEPPSDFQKLSIPVVEGPGGQSIDEMMAQAGADR